MYSSIATEDKKNAMSLSAKYAKQTVVMTTLIVLTTVVGLKFFLPELAYQFCLHINNGVNPHAGLGSFTEMAMLKEIDLEHFHTLQKAVEMLFVDIYVSSVTAFYAIAIGAMALNGFSEKTKQAQDIATKLHNECENLANSLAKTFEDLTTAKQDLTKVEEWRQSHILLQNFQQGLALLNSQKTILIEAEQKVQSE